VEGAKTKIILTALVISVIVVASIGYYLIKDAGVEEITALEGNEIADNIAQSWHQDSVLMGVGALVHQYNFFNYTADKNYGYAIGWKYAFYSPSTEIEIGNQSMYQRLTVTVFSNATIETNETRESYIRSIDGWYIDSNDAYEIAQNNVGINDFNNRSPILMTFILTSDDSITPKWQIGWFYDTDSDIAQRIEININASTGEVLYIDD